MKKIFFIISVIFLMICTPDSLSAQLALQPSDTDFESETTLTKSEIYELIPNHLHDVLNQVHELEKKALENDEGLKIMGLDQGELYEQEKGKGFSVKSGTQMKFSDNLMLYSKEDVYINGSLSYDGNPNAKKTTNSNMGNIIIKSSGKIIIKGSLTAGGTKDFSGKNGGSIILMGKVVQLDGELHVGDGKDGEQGMDGGHGGSIVTIAEKYINQETNTYIGGNGGKGGNSGTYLRAGDGGNGGSVLLDLIIGSEGAAGAPGGEGGGGEDIVASSGDTVLGGLGGKGGDGVGNGGDGGGGGEGGDAKFGDGVFGASALGGNGGEGGNGADCVDWPGINEIEGAGGKGGLGGKGGDAEGAVGQSGTGGFALGGDGGKGGNGGTGCKGDDAVAPGESGDEGGKGGAGGKGGTGGKGKGGDGMTGVDGGSGYGGHGGKGGDGGTGGDGGDGQDAVDCGEDGGTGGDGGSLGAKGTGGNPGDGIKGEAGIGGMDGGGVNGDNGDNGSDGGEGDDGDDGDDGPPCEERSSSNRLGHSFTAGVVKLSEDDSRIAITRYVEAGNSVWRKHYGDNGKNKGMSIDTDEYGNSIVTGMISNTVEFETTTFDSYGFQDIFIVKNDADGNELWARRAGSHKWDAGVDVVLDETGSIYIVGYYREEANFDGIILPYEGDKKNAFVAKYDPDGNIQWVKGFGGLGIDEALSVGISQNGIIYVTGYFEDTVTFDNVNLSSEEGQRLFLLRMDANTGNVVWAVKHEEGNNSSGEALAVDANGHVFIAVREDDQLLMLKYDSDGMLLNELRMASSNPSDDSYFHPKDITLSGNSGHIQIVGSFTGDIHFKDYHIMNKGEQDIFLAELTPELHVVWARNEGGPEMDFGNGIRNDGEGFTSYVGCTFGFSIVEGIAQEGNAIPYYRRFNDENTTSTYNETSSLAHLVVSPNPFTDSFSVILDANESGQVTISVLDVAGRTLHTQANNIGIGENRIIIGATSHIQNGLYFLQVERDNGQRGIEKILKH